MQGGQDLSPMDLALIRGFTQRRVTRRDLLRFAGKGAGALGLSAFLAACGVRGTEEPRAESPAPGEAPASPEPLPELAGALIMANWPLYIDKAKGRSPTLDQFRQEFGIDMKYTEAINDNEEFFGTIQPALSAGQPTGWDIIVMTDWMIAKMIRLGFLEELRWDLLPTVQANLDPKFRDPLYDPGNAHSVPWAAGITGIGYDPSLTGREVTSIEDLFDPAFEGHIGMFTEMRDTFNFMFHLMGVDPQQATLEDVEQATKLLLDQRPLIRGYYGNDYADQLATGNLWVSMAWSGDVFALRLDNPNLRFVIPKEKGNRWVDNMAIPTGAEHPRDAHLFIDYVYRPEIGQQITEWVWYESPVAGTRERILAHGQETGDEILLELADSDTVWPTEETLAQTSPYKFLDEEEEQAWEELFQQVVTG